MYTYRHRPRAFLQIDSTPLWVDLHAIQAISPDEETGETIIALSSGAKVSSPTLSDDVMGLIRDAYDHINSLDGEESGDE